MKHDIIQDKLRRIAVLADNIRENALNKINLGALVSVTSAHNLTKQIKELEALSVNLENYIYEHDLELKYSPSPVCADHIY